jgi:hypothetical protein
VDFSILDVPREAPTDDPLTDVHTFDDLRMFPNLVDQLRSVPVEERTDRPRAVHTPLTCAPAPSQPGRVD